MRGRYKPAEHRRVRVYVIRGTLGYFVSKDTYPWSWTDVRNNAKPFFGYPMASRAAMSIYGSRDAMKMAGAKIVAV